MQKFIDGYTINSLLKEQEEQRFSDKSIFKIAEQLLSALAYIHDQDVVHRDLTLNNVMVDKMGQVQLIDFGVATSIGSDITLQLGCPLFATIPFYAPLTLIDDTAPARDLYALAVLMYVMYGGPIPMTRDPEKAHNSLIKKIKNNALDIRGEVKDVLLACLRGEYSEASKLRKDLLGSDSLIDVIEKQDGQGPHKAPPKLTDYPPTHPVNNVETRDIT